MSGREQEYVGQAFRSNWLSTVGANITAFEDEIERLIGIPAAAVTSGTAALHLALRLLDVGPGDEVFCQSLTFIATANPIRYLGAEPVFLDSERSSWNLDPQVLADAFADRARRHRLPKALIVVDLCGQCADMDPIVELCRIYGVRLLEDSAEALGASYKGKPAGTFGEAGIFSFNGNKIITTTGGGMMVSANAEWVAKARYWAMQARDPGVAHSHSELGYNYRMSNVLAGIGRGQLEVLDLRIRQRRAIAGRYRDAFEDLSGIRPMPELPERHHTHWLSCFLIDDLAFGHSRDELIQILESANIESRPLWKPLHMQRLYQDAPYYGSTVAEDIFHRGICLPSSSSLTDEDQLRVINVIRRAAGRTPLALSDSLVVDGAQLT